MTLKLPSPPRKRAYLHTAIMEERSAFSLDDTLGVAEFFRFRKSEAQKRLDEIRKAAGSHPRQSAPSEIRFMRDAFEYL